MIYRVFLALIALSGIYITYDVVMTYLAQDDAYDVQEGWAYDAPDGTLGVVEFLDYSCPTCQLMSPIFHDAVKRDGRVSFTVKVVDTGYGGGEAARLVYAAGLQGKYMDAHEYVMERIDQIKDIDEAYIDAFAEELSLDLETLRTDMESRETKRAIDNNRDLMQRVGGIYYPTFLLGPRLKAYASKDLRDPEDFLKLFDVARQYYARIDEVN